MICIVVDVDSDARPQHQHVEPIKLWKSVPEGGRGRGGAALGQRTTNQ